MPGRRCIPFSAKLQDHLKEKIMQTAKQAAKQIIDHVPDQATWDDIMYELYVKQKIEKGLNAIDEGRVISNEEAKKRLLGNEN
jgi:predicted transcriptional regulator